MHPISTLLLEVTKILLPGYPHLQPHLDAAQEHIDAYNNRPQYRLEPLEPAPAPESAPVGDAPSAEKPAEPAPAAQADEYTGDGAKAD